MSAHVTGVVSVAHWGVRWDHFKGGYLFGVYVSMMSGEQGAESRRVSHIVHANFTMKMTRSSDGRNL